MGEERTYAEVVSLIEPENLPPTRLSQYSIVTKAMEHHALVKRFDTLKKEMTESNLEFGGRVLLIGPPGTDFEAFSHHLCREVPLKMVRFRMEEMLRKTKRETSLFSIGFEFARRNTPVLLLIERLESITPKNSEMSAVLQDELKRTTWDDDEILVVATTTRPQDLDIETLTLFDRTYVFSSTTLEDRVRVFEQVLKNREEMDPTIIAELTESWGFSDIKRLATSLFMMERDSTSQISRENIEKFIEDSYVIPLTNSRYLSSITQKISGVTQIKLDNLHHEYPDDFLDQLYLLAVSEDYANTQRIIEVLNEGMPLSKTDHEFLSKHPYILNGSPEDRLTRLLRAKKSSDRLQRIMGR
ncbi:ATP-binding protein [Candidatus Thorarchaeota archaeon]|nr:MAG: ATP-binding protein [Candidatus Thorarchaeota archaeon]